MRPGREASAQEHNYVGVNAGQSLGKDNFSNLSLPIAPCDVKKIQRVHLVGFQEIVGFAVYFFRGSVGIQHFPISWAKRYGSHFCSSV
ncbi:hypothetical protein SDC9_141684 [bioreactor metagenome]|uniref:Uncharacterized protein n=1 Tax=bioreactor metagenome TaxID=1076179 RepID=A0A645DZH1_9ZZZZ